MGQTRVYGVKRIMSDGSMGVCIGHILLFERVKHTWGPRIIISVTIDTINHFALYVAKPLTVKCRSPGISKETPGTDPDASLR